MNSSYRKVLCVLLVAIATVAGVALAEPTVIPCGNKADETLLAPERDGKGSSGSKINAKNNAIADAVAAACAEQIDLSKYTCGKCPPATPNGCAGPIKPESDPERGTSFILGDEYVSYNAATFAGKCTFFPPAAFECKGPVKFRGLDGTGLPPVCHILCFECYARRKSEI